MRNRFTAGLHCLALVLAVGCAAVQTPSAGHPTGNVEVVHVAPPTGDRETDRASIQAAVEQVEPGGTIQFAPGTYLIGAGIRIQVARLTLRGHPQGTTLRGCDPDEFATYVLSELGDNCDGLRLLAGHQSVHDLTFEYAFTGLLLGLLWETGGAHRTEGGDRIMNNTFRTGKGVLLDGDWPEPSVIQNNRFINNYHAVNIFGATGHVLDNHFSVPEPERVPIAGFPDEAVRIFPRVREAGDTLPAVCGRNVVAGNRIEGALIGIEIRVREADTSCEGNVIRDNWIAVTPARVPEWSDYGAPDDSRLVYGVALALNDLAAEGSGAESDAAAPRISGNVIEGNRIIRGSGPAIQLYGAAGNRIVDNTITGVRLRETYPGHTLYFPPPGTDANGSGIWISHGSDDNEILGNTFEDIASYALVIEGDSNRVTVRDASDSVRDLGRGNRVSGRDLGTGNRVSGPDTTTSPSAYESRFVESRGVRLHYLDFGGTGLPVIFVHDWYEDAHTWMSFAPLFADAYRVLAMTRRGYGESDDVGWGYDVATQSEDILGFMDALGIERAVLVGRHPTTQDMTWIAEHHAERLAGLVYLYHAIAPSPSEGRMLRDRTFAEMMMRYGGCWMGEEAYHRSAPRLLYRPHYIDHPELRIEVPAISFTHPRDFAAGAGDMEFLDLTLQMATGADPGGGYCDPAAIRTSVDYLTALANDPERLAEVRPLVPTREERKRYAEAFERAFGPGLRIVRLEQPADYRTDPGPYHPHIRTFLEEVARREAGRAAPAGGPTGEDKYE